MTRTHHGASCLAASKRHMPSSTITINRAPVLTLWAAVVAEELGFTRDEALSLGKAVAGLTAQSKGRRLGVFQPASKEIKAARARKRGEEFWIELCGRPVPALNTADGVRAVSGSAIIASDGVERYLRGKFGDALETARNAMRVLAAAFKPDALREKAFALYTEFRPSVPAGVTGWGAKGRLDLGFIRSLAAKAR